jgi:hypothetical protein
MHRGYVGTLCFGCGPHVVERVRFVHAGESRRRTTRR